MKKIEIFGIGCPKCISLAKNAERASKELGLKYEIYRITNFYEIMRLGLLLMTPALAVDGHLEIIQKVASVGEIKKVLIQKQD